MKIAVFDVCDTLYNANTSFAFLDNYFSDNVKYTVFRKFSKSLPGKLLNYPFFKFMKYDLMRVLATRFLSGHDVQFIEKKAREFVYAQLSGKINKEVEKRLYALKKEGFKIVLMSGSYSFLVNHIAEYFSADNFFASELVSSNGKYKGSFQSDQLFTKLVRLKNTYPTIDELIVVSDNKTDLELMQMANKTYIVCNKVKDCLFWQKKFLDSSKVHYLEMYDE